MSQSQGPVVLMVRDQMGPESEGVSWCQSQGPDGLGVRRDQSVSESGTSVSQVGMGRSQKNESNYEYDYLKK